MQHNLTSVLVQFSSVHILTHVCMFAGGLSPGYDTIAGRCCISRQPRRHCCGGVPCPTLWSHWSVRRFDRFLQTQAVRCRCQQGWSSGSCRQSSENSLLLPRGRSEHVTSTPLARATVWHACRYWYFALLKILLLILFLSQFSTLILLQV